MGHGRRHCRGGERRPYDCFRGLRSFLRWMGDDGWARRAATLRLLWWPAELRSVGGRRRAGRRRTDRPGVAGFEGDCLECLIKRVANVN
jgi:hypothetical protein